MKSILRGSVCVCRMGGWGAGPHHHHLTFEPFPWTRGREPHSAKFPLPQSGSRRAQRKPQRPPPPIPQRLTCLEPGGASWGLSLPPLLLQEACPDHCHTQDHTTWPHHGLGCGQHHCQLKSGQKIHHTCPIIGLCMGLIVCFLVTCHQFFQGFISQTVIRWLSRLTPETWVWLALRWFTSW